MALKSTCYFRIS